MKGGSTEAFERILESTRGIVYSAALRVTGRAADAEDVLQETYLRLWTRRAEVVEVLSWLRRVAVNLAIDLRRRRKR